jgi:hypothetical protein
MPAAARARSRGLSGARRGAAAAAGMRSASSAFVQVVRGDARRAEYRGRRIVIRA